MSTETRYIIDLLAGIESGSSLDGIRTRRLQARENAQKSYAALFEPADFGDVPAVEPYAVAAFVAGIHGEPAAAGRGRDQRRGLLQLGEQIDALPW